MNLKSIRRIYERVAVGDSLPGFDALRGMRDRNQERKNGRYFFRFFESEHHCGLADSCSHGAADAAETVTQMDSLSAVGAGGVPAGMPLFPGEHIQSDSQPGDRPA